MRNNARTYTGYTVLVPAYNESRVIRNSILQIESFVHANRIDNNYEILIVENGSTDDTLEIIRQLKESISSIRYIRLSKPDYGAALKEGVKCAKFELIVFLPADLSFGLDFISKSLKLMRREKCDVIVGSKYHESSDVKRPMLRQVISRLFRLLVRTLWSNQLKTRDPHGTICFKKSRFTHLLNYIPNGHMFGVGFFLLAEAKNYKITEIPVKVRETRKVMGVRILRYMLETSIGLIKFRIRSLHINLGEV